MYPRVQTPPAAVPRRVDPKAAVLLAALALLAAALNLGGDGGPAFGEVRGTVAFDGKPLPAGLVVFTNDDDTLSGSAYLRADGTFHAKHVPAGPVRVAVKTEEFRGAITEEVVAELRRRGVPVVIPPSEKGMKYVPIPARYADRKKSQLRCEIRKNSVTDYHVTLTR